MAYCSNCGASNNGATFCPSCGSAQAAGSANQASFVSGAPAGSNSSTAMWAHLGGLLAYFFGGTLLGWVPPLIIRGSETAKRDAYVYEQATEALNFQLQWLLIDVALAIIAVLTCGLGSILFFPAAVLVIIFGIMASVATSSGKPFRYSMMMFRLVK